VIPAALRLLLVTEGTEAQLSAVRAALEAVPRGGLGVQLRDKQAAAGALLARALRLLPLCAAAGAPLLVNDRADVALAAGAQGLHLPGQGLPVAEARRLLGPGRLLGASCHSATEIVAAARGGADYALFGPVFAVPGKGPPQGLAALAEAAAAAPIPVLALGGVDAESAAACLAHGARGVACIRALLDASDPGAAALRLWQMVSK
jgi:thiamine-phosphate pyrophosphorylase